MSKKSLTLTLVSLITLLIFLLFFIRLSSPREIDDVSPSTPCETDLLKKSDIYWVIPLFENVSIAENKSWCNDIIASNKTIGMHGVYHTYKELESDRDEAYIWRGISAFNECFGRNPELFKPSHLAISKNNKKIIEKIGLERKGYFNQITNKVYHCSDTGVYSNWVIDLF